MIALVSCGGNHTAVVMNNGDLYTWGDGQYGATGLNSSQNTFAPIRVQVPASGNQLLRFAQVSCGKRHSLAISTQGHVYATGDNSYRQLGLTGVNEVMAFVHL